MGLPSSRTGSTIREPTDIAGFPEPVFSRRLPIRTTTNTRTQPAEPWVLRAAASCRFLSRMDTHHTEMVFFSHAIGGTTNQMFFERELGPSGQVQGFRFGDEVQLADAMLTSKVMEHVNQLAAKGYRFLAGMLRKKAEGEPS